MEKTVIAQAIPTQANQAGALFAQIGRAHV